MKVSAGACSPMYPDTPTMFSRILKRLVVVCERVGIIHTPGLSGWILSTLWIAGYLGNLIFFFVFLHCHAFCSIYYINDLLFQGRRTFILYLFTLKQFTYKIVFTYMYAKLVFGIFSEESDYVEFGIKKISFEQLW